MNDALHWGRNWDFVWLDAKLFVHLYRSTRYLKGYKTSCTNSICNMRSIFATRVNKGLTRVPPQKPPPPVSGLSSFQKVPILAKKNGDRIIRYDNFDRTFGSNYSSKHYMQWEWTIRSVDGPDTLGWFGCNTFWSICLRHKIIDI